MQTQIRRLTLVSAVAAVNDEAEDEDIDAVEEGDLDGEEAAGFKQELERPRPTCPTRPTASSVRPRLHHRRHRRRRRPRASGQVTVGVERGA
jgi:hypothetical protein